jgi:hypothetical protein
MQRRSPTIDQETGQKGDLMKLVELLPGKHLIAVTLLAACLGIGGITVWYASTHPTEASSKEQQKLKDRLRRGVGSEVRFASAAAKSEDIDEAIASTTDFIYRRSGLKLSDETRKRLAKAERKVLKGEIKHITIAELTNDLTASAIDRVSKLTDEEIQQASEMSANEYGEIRLRADGQWGTFTKQEWIQQAKFVRDMSQQQDNSALWSTLHPRIEEEVNNRVVALSAALPEQFGESRTQGITPTHALLVAYSVAADDPLTDSRGDIDQLVMQMRIEKRQTREQKKAQKHSSGRLYGPYGLLHPSAPHLFFSATSVDKLLKLDEGGTK